MNAKQRPRIKYVENQSVFCLDSDISSLSASHSHACSPALAEHVPLKVPFGARNAHRHVSCPQGAPVPEAEQPAGREADAFISSKTKTWLLPISSSLGQPSRSTKNPTGLLPIDVTRGFLLTKLPGGSGGTACPEPRSEMHRSPSPGGPVAMLLPGVPRSKLCL